MFANDGDGEDHDGGGGGSLSPNDGICIYTLTNTNKKDVPRRGAPSSYPINSALYSDTSNTIQYAKSATGRESKLIQSLAD